jgi:hypothetical protein
MIRHAFWRAAPFALLLLWAPLPFASVSPPFPAILAVATVAAFAIAILSGHEVERLEELRPVAIGAALVAVVAVAGWLQSLAWPSGLVSAIAPGIAAIARRSSQLLEASSDRLALSLATESSRAAALDWAMPVAAFLGAALVGGSRRARRSLLAALLVASAVQLAIGLQLWISRSDSLWGVTLAHFPGRLRGSFVNPNHLALFLEIALMVNFAWLWWSSRRAILRTRSAEDRLLRIGPAALAFLILFAGLVLTASRAGVVAATGGLAAAGALIASARHRRWSIAAGALVAAGGGLVLWAIGAEGAITRLLGASLSDLGGGGRLRAALATLELWTLSPLTGVGLGAFRASFPLVQPESLPGLWRHAHSDWVELLATTGLVGVALVGTALFLYLRRLRVVIAHGESSEDRAAGIAAAGALVAVGLHSLVDFGLTMPANALALAVVLGAAAAARTRPAAANPSAE